MPQYIAFPFDFDSRGMTVRPSQREHIRQLIEQVLFTSAGERVYRSAFGSGLMQMVFAPNSDQLAATLHAVTEASLQQWLGDLIQVHRLEITNEDARLDVQVDYSILNTDESRSDRFVRELDL